MKILFSPSEAKNSGGDIKKLDNVKFQIMFPLVSHLCFHFFKQVSRV